MSDQALYGQTYQQILSSVLGNKGNFQLAYPYIDWYWKTAGTGQMSANALNLVNSLPAWSAVGAYDPSGPTLLQAYQQVLQHVNPTVPADQQQAVTNAQNDLTAASNQVATDTAARNRAWVIANNDLPPGVPAPDWTQWGIDSGWTATLAVDTLNTAKKQESLRLAIGQQNPALTSALAQATPPTSVNTVKSGWTTVDQGDGTMVPAPAFSIGSTGQDWMNLLSMGGGNKVTINIGQSQSSSDLNKSWAGGNASYGNPFWGINAGGAWQKWDLDESDASVSATIELTTTTVQVTPGAWYNGAYLSSLAKQNNWYQPYTSFGGSQPIFGQGGILPLNIVSLVAGYQPKFTITMSSNTYSQQYEKYEASGGIRIGPFRFGGSGGHESNTINKASSSTTFTGESTATYPFILGVVVEQPGQ